MRLKDYFERIYKPLSTDVFAPSRKNAGILVHFFFKYGGSNYFPCNKATFVSKDVWVERKLYDESRPLNQQMKDSFPSPISEELVGYVASLLDKAAAESVARNFGIPLERNIDAGVLARALVLQFQLYINSPDEEVSDIVSEEYERFSADMPSDSSPQLFPRYPDDKAYLIKVTPQDMNIPIYTEFNVTWEIKNNGKQTWKNRKLFYSNYNRRGVRPKAEQILIDIPTTEPGETISISTTMNTRGKQGSTVCEWIMIDETGMDCFPDSTRFYITVTGIWECASNEEGI